MEAIIYTLPETNSSPLKIGKDAQRKPDGLPTIFCAHSITNPINKTPGSRFITPLTHLFSAIYKGCKSIHQLSPLGSTKERSIESPMVPGHLGQLNDSGLFIASIG